MIIRDRMPQLRGALKALTANRVLVGIPAEEALRKPVAGEPRNPVNNAFLGYIHENGAPEVGIPPRPWLIAGIRTVQGDIAGRFQAVARAALDGRPYDIDKTLGQVGLVAQNGVKAKINTGPFIPLKPSTLAARRRRGRTGDRPLIDTGQFRNSVTYVIRPANALTHA